TNVHVTVCPGATAMFDIGLPLSQVALDWSQPAGTVWDSEYPLFAWRLEKVRVFDSVGSESSSSENEPGESPPPALNAKSCGSFGCASFTTVIDPRFWFVNVQVTVCAGRTSMFETALALLHGALWRSQPVTDASETEYPFF